VNISEILELNERAREDGKSFPRTRQLFSGIQSEQGKHFIGIAGPRGVGKTVMLKQLALYQPDSFYISVDTLAGLDLFQTARILSEQYKINILLLDEIHFCKTYAKDLKKIYDFLNLRVVFTSSVSLSLFDSAYDLSRRIMLRHMYPFSFREYLLFNRNIEISQLTLNDIIEGRWTSDHMKYNHLFDEYLQGRLFPFTLEEPDFIPLFRNICLKVIRKDIPMVSNLRFDDIEKIENTVEFIGKSEVDGVNFSSISRNLGITKYKAAQYVKLLEQAFILNSVYPKGTNVLKEPKVLMFLPFRLLYRDWSECVGAIREDFFAETMKMEDQQFHYLKTKRGAKTPDFLVDTADETVVVEIGGKSKGREQFKGIKVNKKLILTHSPDVKSNKKPLSLLGFVV
jgi:hypothetical protein